MFLFKRIDTGYWYVGWYENRRRVNKSTRTRSKAEANEFYRKFKSKKKYNRVFLNEFSSECLKYAEVNLSASSLWQYRNAFLQLERILGCQPLSGYQARDFERYKQHRCAEVSQTTVNIELRTLKAVFNLALKWNYLESNPLVQVRQFKVPEKLKSHFTREELDLILNNVTNLNLKQIVLFALYTGCRIGEVLNLQWCDIDLERRVIAVCNKSSHLTKNRGVRYIPVSDQLFDLLNSISVRNVDGYLWRFKKNYISRSFKRVLRRLNFAEHYHFHCLRHTFASTLNRQNVQATYIQKLLGHKDLKTTLIYVDSITDDLRDAVNTINLMPLNI